MHDELRDAAIRYHEGPPAGKLRIQATKPLTGQRDLSLAYSPGVAAACEEIANDPGRAADLTARGNLVAVVTNGTAVLGMGPIGALASKPVMEGKAVLFKKFAGIDAFDIELDERDPERLVDIVAALEPTFGAINLEDIRAPECFHVESELRKRMRIPVFHDDQHGTAIVTAAAILNGLELVDKRLEDVQIVTSGAGAAAIACLNLLVSLGARREHIMLSDLHGVLYTGREKGLDPYNSLYARDTALRRLDEAIEGADVFLGLSAGGVLKPEFLRRMAARPLILALANPEPEIMPELARQVRPDAIIATGRSDFPNQVNNVLCFPFIFRGALDVGATTINEQMKLACVEAIASIARAEASAEVATAYRGQTLTFGPDYLLPKPFDPRLITDVPPAIARAAEQSGVATRPIKDPEEYRRRLTRVIFRSGNVMEPVFNAARQAPRRLLYSDGEEERVLRAAQVVVNEGYAWPTLIGRDHVIRERIRELGLSLQPERNVTIVDPSTFEDYDTLAERYHTQMGRRGVHPENAHAQVRANPTLLGSLLLERGDVDAMIAGPMGRYRDNLAQVLSVVPLRPDVPVAAALQLLILDTGTYFIADAYVNVDPDAECLASIVELAAEQVHRFGITPRIALLSHSNFGGVDNASTRKLRDALHILQTRAPELEVDGEMQFDAAIMEDVRRALLPDTRLRGRANLLVMPNLDAASITFNALKVLGNGISVGPILLGPSRTVHILNRTVTARGLLNMSALAVVDAQDHAQTET